MPDELPAATLPIYPGTAVGSRLCNTGQEAGSYICTTRLNLQVSRWFELRVFLLLPLANRFFLPGSRRLIGERHGIFTHRWACILHLGLNLLRYPLQFVLGPQYAQFPGCATRGTARVLTSKSVKPPGRFLHICPSFHSSGTMV